ncbi:hypothetical protein BCR33DRAFT_719599 [Rhizoclosmatium globosum]|uniref:Uncharacterized protein n=1 Tax=Rhizoclosmatium globosum TaxID=329046 RepID=A0A1Y2BZP8_9FUNG|nr:hypothetical protein BCR33DRAFT_719599 [Rhizoclosmatium globosum]|eukprot:ORY40240.1 hypothetical protein BCR33DRAFT_719599 [Rhizoclosmatium globosum]
MQRLTRTLTSLSPNASPPSIQCQWDTLTEFPLQFKLSTGHPNQNQNQNATASIHLVSVSQRDPRSSDRVSHSIGSLKPSFVAFEAAPKASPSNPPKQLDPFLKDEITKNNWLHFAFDKDDGSVLNSAVVAARSANSVIKAIDLDPLTLLYPSKPLASHFNALLTAHNLPLIPEKVRTTPLSNALYSGLTSPLLLPRSDFEHSLQGYKTWMKSWCMFHPKQRHYLCDVRESYMVGQLAALAKSALLAGDGNGNQQDVTIVAVVGKARVFGITDLWTRFYGPEAGGEASKPTRSATTRSVSSIEPKPIGTNLGYYIPEENAAYYDILKTDDFDLMRKAQLQDALQQEAVRKLEGAVFKSKPGVRIIQGSNINTRN